MYKEEELLRASTKSVPSSRGSPHSSKSTKELLGLEQEVVELGLTAGTVGADGAELVLVEQVRTAGTAGGLEASGTSLTIPKTS